MNTNFNWNYFGLTLSLNSTDSSFTNLIERKFNIFNQVATHAFEKRKIQISFSNKIVKNFDDDVSDKKIISKSSYISKNSLFIIHEYLTTNTIIKTTFNIKDIQLIEILFNTSFIFELANFITKGMLKRQLFQNLIKLYIEQSLLWYLTSEHGLHCLHAASIEKNNKVTVFTGLNGVGKSTLALFLSKQTETKVFSDNYLLVDSQNAYLFPDSVRLTKNSMNLLNLNPDGDYGFNKYSILNNFVNFSNKTKEKIDAVYITFRGNKWSKKKLSSADGQNIIQNLQISNAEEVKFAPISQYFPQKSYRSLSSLKCSYFELIVGLLEEMPYEF